MIHLFFLKQGKEDKSMMKREVSCELTLESGPEHRSGISTVHSRTVGYVDIDVYDDATKAFLSYQLPPEMLLGLQSKDPRKREKSPTTPVSCSSELSVFISETWHSFLSS